MLELQPTDALLVIDMQLDFLPSTPQHASSLPVSNGDAILPGINSLASRFDHVLLTQDWHPAGHISFASAHPGKRPYTDTAEAHYGPQTLWPDHTVQGSAGAALSLALDIPHAELILRKGFRRHIDSYSAFVENDKTTGTGLAGFLRERNLTRLFFCGLAFDFCVGYSALDAVRLGFDALVVEDLTRAVNLPATATSPGTVEHTKLCFASTGVRSVNSAEIASPDGVDR